MISFLHFISLTSLIILWIRYFYHHYYDLYFTCEKQWPRCLKSFSIFYFLSEWLFLQFVSCFCSQLGLINYFKSSKLFCASHRKRTNSFPVGSAVRCSPELQETWDRSLSREDPLEKEMATHSCILAWEIPWREKPGGLRSIGLQESNMT